MSKFAPRPPHPLPRPGYLSSVRILIISPITPNEFSPVPPSNPDTLPPANRGGLLSNGVRPSHWRLLGPKGWPEFSKQLQLFSILKTIIDFALVRNSTNSGFTNCFEVLISVSTPQLPSFQLAVALHSIVVSSQ